MISSHRVLKTKSQNEQIQICIKNMQNLEHIYAYLSQFFFWGGGARFALQEEEQALIIYNRELNNYDNMGLIRHKF